MNKFILILPFRNRPRSLCRCFAKRMKRVHSGLDGSSGLWFGRLNYTIVLMTFNEFKPDQS